MVILYTTDTHSQIDPYTNTRTNEYNMGGFLRREAAIRQVRCQHPNILLLDAGDFSQGTPYFNVYQGYVEVFLMNQMHYDAITLGNHEFDNGCAALARRLRKADFPALCANYKFQNKALTKIVKPYIILDKADLKIGIFGLLVDLKGLVSPNIYRTTQYLDPVATARTIVSELQQQHCDLIICLSHLGTDDEQINDFTIAQEVPEIDFILGGHSHQDFIPPKIINNIPVFQLKNKGKRIGQITLTY